MAKGKRSRNRTINTQPDWKRAGVFVSLLQEGMPKGANLGWLAERFSLVAGISYERALHALAAAHERLKAEMQRLADEAARAAKDEARAQGVEVAP